MQTAKATPLSVRLSADAPLEDVIAVVEAIYRRSGCVPCGRLSFHIVADELINPVVKELQEIPSFRSVQMLGDVAGKTLVG